MNFEYNNLIILNNNIDRDKNILSFLESINIKDHFVCNRKGNKYTVIYYNDILKILTFEYENFGSRKIKIELYNNVDLVYNEEANFDCITNNIEFYCHDKCIKILANENNKAEEIKKLL